MTQAIYFLILIAFISVKAIVGAADLVIESNETIAMPLWKQKELEGVSFVECF